MCSSPQNAPKTNESYWTAKNSKEMHYEWFLFIHSLGFGMGLGKDDKKVLLLLLSLFVCCYHGFSYIFIAGLYMITHYRSLNEKRPHRFPYLNIWCAVGGSAGGSMCCGWDLRVYDFTLFTVLSASMG